MKTRLLKSATLTLVALSVSAGLALAGGEIGGHDETSEGLSNWSNASAPTPGVVAPAGVAPHVLISEVVMTPTAGEYIEICNGTGVDVDLSSFCLSDNWFTGPVGYFNRPSAGYSVGGTTDFDVCFPQGTIIPPGGVYTIAVSAVGFNSTYGFAPDFEIRSDSLGIADMVNVGGNSFSTALITNSSEFVVLYCWDGQSDLVCDVDYVSWGDITSSGNQVDKTGLLVDGPDADATPSAYNADTPLASQVRHATAGFGFSLQRSQCAETTETLNGNGCTEPPTPTEPSTWGAIKARHNR